MVGKSKRVKRELLVNVVMEFLNHGFSFGGTSAHGYDCLGLVGRFAQRRGKYFPESFNDIDISNYKDVYLSDQNYIKIMVDFFSSFAEEIDTNFISVDDLLLIEQSNGQQFPAIYIGGCNAISSFIRSGVKIFRIDKDNAVKRAWRLCQQKQ